MQIRNFFSGGGDPDFFFASGVQGVVSVPLQC